MKRAAVPSASGGRLPTTVTGFRQTYTALLGVGGATTKMVVSGSSLFLGLKATPEENKNVTDPERNQIELGQNLPPFKSGQAKQARYPCNRENSKI